MKIVIVALSLFLQVIAQGQTMLGLSILTPRITVDPESAEGITDNVNVRCFIYSLGGNGVVIDLMIKKGFVDVGVNLRINDNSGDLVSTFLAPRQQKDGWVRYSFATKRNLLESCLLDIYRSEQSYKLTIGRVPVRKENRENKSVK